MCPVDSGYAVGNAGGTSYAASVGYGFQLENKYNGLFDVRRVSASDVTDGASNTTAFAEWLIGRIAGQSESDWDDRRRTYRTPELSKPDELSQFVEACREASERGYKTALSGKGLGWLEPGLGKSAYCHTLGVNENTCLNGNRIREGAWSAGSRHAGCANVAFADGHVQPITETMDLKAWRAASTRAGGESFNPSEY